MVGLGGRVREHRARDEPLSSLDRQPEQEPWEAHRGRLTARRQNVQGDREEQLPVIRIVQIEVVQHLLRHHHQIHSELQHTINSLLEFDEGDFVDS